MGYTCNHKNRPMTAKGDGDGGGPLGVMQREVLIAHLQQRVEFSRDCTKSLFICSFQNPLCDVYFTKYDGLFFQTRFFFFCHHPLCHNISRTFISSTPEVPQIRGACLTFRPRLGLNPRFAHGLSSIAIVDSRSALAPRKV